MNQNLIIDANLAQFLITCPFWANELVRNLPNRRWSKSKKAWTAPVIRANVEAVEGLVSMDGVQITQNGRDAIAAYHAERDSTNVGAGFPHWYKFKRPPRKHQITALNKAYGKSAFAFFMDMQTGKSKTLIDTLAALRMEGKIQAALIITKRTLRRNWINAFNDDCPIPFLAHLPETDKELQFNVFLRSQHDFKIMLVGWESLSAGGMADMCEQFLLAHHPTAIGGDETNYITNHKATRSKRVEKMARMAEYRFALTGTGTAEGPMNLYQQFEFLDPNIIGIGDFYAFRNRYAVMGGFVPKDGPMRGKPTAIVGYQNLDELMELIAPHSFQIMKADAYDLPPKRYQVRDIEMTKEQWAVYKRIKKDGIINMNDGSERAVQNTLETMLRLHQVCGGYTVTGKEVFRTNAKGEVRMKMHYDPIEIISPDKNPKLSEVESIIEEAGHKQSLIWAVYASEIKIIANKLRAMGKRVGELHGGVPDEERQPMVDAFKRGEYDCVVGNASTGGMGFSMHTAEVNIFWNNTHKLRDRLQAEDRSWGDGQTRPGIWIDLVCNKTVDRTIMAAIEQKQDLHEFIRQRLKQAHKLMDGEID